MSNYKQTKPPKDVSSSYFGDHKLYSRIKMFLDTRSPETVTVDQIADNLQQNYSEYSRKKKNAFRKYVHKAYVMIKKDDIGNEEKGDTYNKYEANYLKKRKVQLSANSDGGKESNSDDFSEDNADYVEYKDQNGVNNMISGMYKNRRTSYSAPSSACSSPKRSDDVNQTPGLGKSFFVIDRSGMHQRNKSVLTDSDNLSLANTTSTPKSDKLGKFDSSSRLNDTCDRGLESINESNVSDYLKNRKTVIPGSSSKRSGTELNKEDEKNDGKKKKKLDKDSVKKDIKTQLSSVTFADVGGSDDTLKDVCKLLIHMKHPEIYNQLGITPPRGFLLHGPPGCGKTLLANAIAGELAQPMVKISAPEVVSGVSGESEEKLRELFNSAIANSPCILFIDEIDCICQKRENASKDMERRIVAQLLTCMDELNDKPETQVLVIGATNRPDTLDPALRRAGRFDREICMGIPGEKARQRILEVLCRGLRLEENFDFLKLARNSPGFVGADLMALSREAAITAVNRVFTALQESNMSSKKSIPVKKQCNSSSAVTEYSQICFEKSSPSELTSECMEIEETTQDASVPDSDTNDKNELVVSPLNVIPNEMSTSNKAGPIGHSVIDKKEDNLTTVLNWLKEQPPLTNEELSNLFITMGDFEIALKHVQPSAKREGFATIPDVTWEDIGALQDIREELQMAILAPIHHPEQFKSLGLTNPPGILLAGPPGCGKTLLAKAIANESGLNFISVKGPELLNMYVGESERAVRQVFQRARNSTPCVIFFDELDALCPRRSGTGEGGSSVRVVNQLLTEMDGLEERKQVFIMGATNRPDIIDPAILRPGRLDKQLYVGLPGEEDKLAILNTLTKNGTKPLLSSDVCLKEISSDPKCQCLSGADLAALVREASVIALKQYMTLSCQNSQPVTVNRNHFEMALSKIKPSVSKQDLMIYEKMKQTLVSS